VSIQELKDACDYLLIPFDASIIKCQNLRKSVHCLVRFIFVVVSFTNSMPSLTLITMFLFLSRCVGGSALQHCECAGETEVECAHVDSCSRVCYGNVGHPVEWE